jgi:N-acetyl-alpha-D-muramate 1-phosphate uridylyltransferase
MIKKAMVLAAGFGKRLNPLTLSCPKPLLKFGNETLLFNTLKFLELAGIEQAIINVHYLAEQIEDYIHDKKFKIKIEIIKENKEILDTGGGILNVIEKFSNEPFLTINPDTIWSSEYLKELDMMKKIFFGNKEIQCLLLVVNKKKSYDSSIIGDFELNQKLINRKNKNNLDYIYTGLQIIKPEVFLNLKYKVFSINKIWDQLILNKKLYGMKSDIDFLHVSTLDIYEKLLKKIKH